MNANISGLTCFTTHQTQDFCNEKLIFNRFSVNFCGKMGLRLGER